MNDNYSWLRLYAAILRVAGLLIVAAGTFLAIIFPLLAIAGREMFGHAIVMSISSFVTAALTGLPFLAVAELIKLLIDWREDQAAATHALTKLATPKKAKPAEATARRSK